MGLLGFPLSVPLGGHEEMIKTMEIDDVGDGPRVRFEPHSGYDQYFRLVVDGVAQGAPVYGRNGVRNEVTGVFESPDTTHMVSLCPQGDWATDTIDVSGQYIYWQAGITDRIYSEITPQLQFFSYGESGQLTAWSLSGLKRFANCRPVAHRQLWGILECELTNSGTTRTVTLKLDGLTVASGSRTGDGSVTLTASNASGITGSVTVTYTGDVTSGANIVARWPAQIKAHHKTSIFAAPDFPRTAEGTIYDDGRQNLYLYRSARLAAGTYYVVPHTVDENGTESTGIALGGSTVVLNTPPGAPGVPVYTSGGAAATIITFDASATAGATYDCMDSNASGILDVDTVANTRASGTGSLTHALAALTDLSFTGIRYVLMRALSGGVQEKNTNILEIEYAAGVVVLPRPPIPGVGQNVTTVGRALTVPFTIDTNEQLASAATVELFLFAVGGSPTYGTADASTAVGTAIGGIIQGTISFTAAGNVDRMWAIRTKTSGGVQSNNTETYGPVRLTTAVPDDPASFTVREGL